MIHGQLGFGKMPLAVVANSLAELLFPPLRAAQFPGFGTLAGLLFGSHWYIVVLHILLDRLDLASRQGICYKTS